MRIVIEIDAPAELTQGIKEAVCMALEPWGQGRVVEVSGGETEQVRLCIT